MTRFHWTQAIIFRDHVQYHRDWTYLFGDNATHKGMGGMAKECRGEPNAVGIPTKWTPWMNDAAFFSDDENDIARGIPQDLIEAAIVDAESRGLPIIVPYGLGRGLAQMPRRCPRIYEWMCRRLERPTKKPKET